MFLVLTALLLAQAQDDPAADGPAGEVAVEALDDVDAPPEGLAATCHRLVGVAGGVFQPGRSWEFSARPVGLAGSPVLGMTCDLGRSLPVLLGAQFLPLYQTRQWDSSAGHRVWMSVSVGLLPAQTGAGRLRLGPVATLSWRRVGGGLRLLNRPFGDDERPRGFDARLQAFYNGGLEGQLLLSYTLDTKRFPR